MAVISLVKAIAQQIKYFELVELIGQSVIIKGVDSIYDDVHKGLSLPHSAIPHMRNQKHLKSGIAKYGLIDIDFTIEGVEIDNGIRGIEAIRKLSLYQEYSNTDHDDFLLEAGIGFLEDMVEELKLDKTFYMLFLQTEYPQSNGKEKIRQHFKLTDALPSDYFPCEFVVKDAALCNTKLAWMMKHFYL